MKIRIGILAIIILFATSMALPGADKTPKFNASDLKVIDAYYTHVLGNLAPGSVDRVGFSPEVERALKAGEKLPLQLEKKLESIPRELEEKLSAPPAGYAIYKLGLHLLILRRSDLEIADIIKDVGLTGGDY